MNARRDNAHAVCATLRQAGYRALLAGGCVRDGLLGVDPQDYDVATSARPENVQRLFDKCIPVGEAFGVVRVRIHGDEIEVATFRKDGPYLDGRHPASVEFRGEEEDAQRRDFTVNALFYDPETETVVDYVGGQRDLHDGLIRAVGDPGQRFAEDHLRLARAVRFAARLGYAIEPQTLAAIRAHAAQVMTTSAERLRDELLKMLCEGQARRAFELLDETGLLHHLLPEVEAMHGVQQPPDYHPEGDVFVHTIMLLERLRDPSPTLALGALLHDVGKPPTQTFEDRIRFNQHDKVGAGMADAICRRFRLSNHERQRVVWLVAQHMRIATAPNMRESKLKRFVREDGFSELLELHRLDCAASHGNFEVYEWLVEYIANLEPDAVAPPPLLNGNDLIALGYTPGPQFKTMLTALEDLQLEGALATRDEALHYIQTHWPTKDNP